MIHHFPVKRLRTAFCLAMIVAVTACGGGGSSGDGGGTPSNNDKSLSGNEDKQSTIIGSVGDGPIVISNTTPGSYVWGELSVGATVFVDRGFTYTTVPASCIGVQALRTANNDKASTANELIRFDVNQAVTVYVAYDKRISGVASWLSSWTDTGADLVDTDTSRRLYRASFSVGTVTLGANDGGGSNMYTVLVAEQNSNCGNVGTGATPLAQNDSGYSTMLSKNSNKGCY